MYFEIEPCIKDEIICCSRKNTYYIRGNIVYSYDGNKNIE